MRKVPLSKKQKRAEKIKKMLIHAGIWLAGLIIVIALGIFAVRGFGIRTVYESDIAERRCCIAE